MTYSRPLKIILFGSASRNEMTDGSDVDLIVIYPNGENLRDIQLNLAKNRDKDDWPHDLILKTVAEFDLSVSKGGGACWLASREGRILYDKELEGCL